MDPYEMLDKAWEELTLEEKRLVAQATIPPVFEFPTKKDPIVEAVRQDLLTRSQVGLKKYNTTLDRKDLSLKDWLQHAYEECLDQANYLKRSIIELESKEGDDEYNAKYREPVY